MSNTQQEQVLARLCPHRGIGQENSLDAIGAGIKTSPLFVEFDIQWNNNNLYLGHPPVVGNDTLSQALELFKNTPIIPKIDIKLTSQTSNLALDELINQMSGWNPQKALINIAGDLNADEYFDAEKKLIAYTGDNVLLNIDLERYRGKNESEILTHINGLSRVPFSISPNLQTSTKAAIDFAKHNNIGHIHFWSFFDKKYTINNLYSRLEICKRHNLDVYFDIKTQNISDL